MKNLNLFLIITGGLLMLLLFVLYCPLCPVFNESASDASPYSPPPPVTAERHPIWWLIIDSSPKLSSDYRYCMNKIESFPRHVDKDSLLALMKFAEKNLPKEAADQVKSVIFTRF